MKRFEKLKELGIITESTFLSGRGEDIAARQDEPMKEWQARRMEVYAGMIDMMNLGIAEK